VTQLVIPLHECVVEPLHDAAKSVVDLAATEATTDPAAVESTVEPLHSIADPTGFGAALTKTFCLCVRV
jgi:hypothetical protein